MITAGTFAALLVVAATIVALIRPGRPSWTVVALGAAVLAVARALEPGAGHVAAVFAASIALAAAARPYISWSWLALPMAVAAAAEPSRLLQPAGLTDLLPGASTVAATGALTGALLHIDGLSARRRWPWLVALAALGLGMPVAIVDGRAELALPDGAAVSYAGPLLLADTVIDTWVARCWDAAHWLALATFATLLAARRRLATGLALVGVAAALVAGVRLATSIDGARAAGVALIRVPGSAIAAPMLQDGHLSLAPAILRAAWTLMLASIGGALWLRRASAAPEMQDAAAAAHGIDLGALFAAFVALGLAATVGRGAVGAGWTFDAGIVGLALIVLGVCAAYGRSGDAPRVRVARLVAALGAWVIVGGGTVAWRVASALVP
jgi:hypothetical protein